MAKQSINTIKNWFKTSLKPTQAQFWDWLDSFVHKDDKIPLTSLEGLQDELDKKASLQYVDSKAVNSDWNATAGVSAILNKPNLDYITYNEADHRLDLGLNLAGEAVQNLKLSADFDLELFSADVDIFGIDSAKLRSFGGVTIDSGTGVNINTGTGQFLLNGEPLGSIPYITYVEESSEKNLHIGVKANPETGLPSSEFVNFLELLGDGINILANDYITLSSNGDIDANTSSFGLMALSSIYFKGYGGVTLSGGDGNESGGFSGLRVRAGFNVYEGNDINSPINDNVSLSYGDPQTGANYIALTENKTLINSSDGEINMTGQNGVYIQSPNANIVVSATTDLELSGNSSASLYSQNNIHILSEGSVSIMAGIGNGLHMSDNSSITVGGVDKPNDMSLSYLGYGFAITETNTYISSPGGITASTDNNSGLHILDGVPFYAGGYPRADNVSLTCAYSGIAIDEPSSDVYLFSGGGSVKVFAEYSMIVSPPLYLEQGLTVEGSLILNTQYTPQNSSAWAANGTLFADNDYLYYKGTGNLLKRIAWTAF